MADGADEGAGGRRSGKRGGLKAAEKERRRQERAASGYGQGPGRRPNPPALGHLDPEAFPSLTPTSTAADFPCLPTVGGSAATAAAPREPGQLAGEGPGKAAVAAPLAAPP
eukprot:CAMPEP_0206048196 /NCGR_PEP_ID=MMETSP1466-20131121/23434_1 /ASSEMBLY_ACC=CAM_ASM_001126 /TAXON_ID=44452 /ORGANISM="Pavlova gyrans, Strain CCMP608" /LENGTH=110 /DNA_ID=CAMNT_0053423239 /DNA_START=19 /DNA_END=347 /DNA_ORIENTATION=+